MTPDGRYYGRYAQRDTASRHPLEVDVDVDDTMQPSQCKFSVMDLKSMLVKQFARSMVIGLLGWVALSHNACFAAVNIAGADGRLYFWGLDGFYGWTTDDLNEQRSVVQGAYLLPGRHVKQVTSQLHLWRAAIDTEGDVYVLGYWPGYSTLPVLPSGAQKIPTPVGVRATAIAAGSETWVAAMSDGSLYGWGSVFHDQGGCNGCAVAKSYRLPENEQAINVSAAGYALAVTASGKVFAIGYAPGGYASSSYDDIVASAARIPFPSDVAIATVAAGNEVAAAVSTTGRLFVWGSSVRGQLGTGSLMSSAVPVELALPSGKAVKSISFGYQHTVAIDVEGKAFAWGANDWGQLGDGTAVTRYSPVPVAAVAGEIWTDVIATEWSSAALSASGQVRTWGAAYVHDLASGNRDPAIVARSVGSVLPSTPIDIVQGRDFSLALMSNGEVYARGSNVYGQLANNDSNRAPMGRWVKTVLADITRIAGANNRGAAVDKYGRVFSWGLIYTPNEKPSDVTLVSLPVGVTAVDVAVGNGYTVVRTSNGKLYAWGTNLNGELGTGDRVSQSQPVQVMLPNDAFITSISSHYLSSYAISADGRLFGWGFGVGQGQLPTPLNLPQGVAPKAVAAGGFDSFMLGTNGLVYYIGASFNNLPVPGGAPASSIAAGMAHVFVRTATGTTFERDANANANTPLTEVPAAVSYRLLVAGYYAALAISNSGDVVGWGQNGNSAVVGDFRTRSSYVPDCAFDATGSCALGTSYPVSIVASNHGNVAPAGTLRAYAGGDVQFHAQADAGYIAKVTGCGASVANGIVTTGSISSACVVNVNFSRICSLDIDEDGQVSAETDGLLMLRAMLGFSGSTLASGINILDTPIAIERAYQRYQALANSGVLDLDGDGVVSAVTDGLLLLRSMLGLTGSALTAGATGRQSTKTADQISAFIPTTCQQ